MYSIGCEQGKSISEAAEKTIMKPNLFKQMPFEFLKAFGSLAIKIGNRYPTPIHKESKHNSNKNKQRENKLDKKMSSQISH